MNDKNQQIVASSQSVIFSGPLPSSDEFTRYEAARPGTAERILVMAEKEAEHRQEMESIAVKSTSRLNSTGQVLGFVIALLSIGAVFASIFLNRPLAAIAPAFITLIGLASVFTGKKH